MSKFFATVLCLSLFVCSSSQAQPLLSQDFNQADLGDWYVSRSLPMTEYRNQDGNGFIEFKDIDPKAGTAVSSPMIQAKVGQYTANLRIRQLQGMGFGMGIHAFNKDKKHLGKIASYNISSRAKTTDWVPLTCTGYVDSDEVAFVQINFGTWTKSIAHFQADEASLSWQPIKYVPPAWKPQYKIKPNETSKLTAADVVGPDGIVYPNWKFSGIPGGIPTVFKNKVLLSDFGGKPNDKIDDADAIEAAVTALGKQGGGILQLADGVYDLHRPVMITYPNIVLRGQGVQQTQIIYAHEIAEGQVDFWQIKDGQTIGPNSKICIYTPPAKFKQLQLDVNGKKFETYTPSMHSGNRSYLYTSPNRRTGVFTSGKYKLTATAFYKDGSSRTSTIHVNFDPDYAEPVQCDPPRAAINFFGTGFGLQHPLAADGLRGKKSVTLKQPHRLKVGQWVQIRANETPARRKLVRNACNWGTYRNYILKITNVQDQTLTFDRPLRIDFPVADESYLRELELTESCGVEDLTFEQTVDMWLTSIEFHFAAYCWAQNVNVIKCGRNPVYMDMATQSEIKDCVFTEAWFKGGGGTAYVGWQKTYDCLMQNVTTTNMRHAPLFQWSASGNVIRDSVFHNSDAQWHSGWTHENLIENCIVTSKKGHGSYGFGMWASPPEDGAHGPNGPRNVVYNCDVASQKDAVWVGGMNENWLILHNRFVVEKGVGFFTKDNSFDHIIKGNTFVLKDQKSAMVKLVGPDCSGVEITENKLYGGNGKILSGLGLTDIQNSNVVMPLSSELPKRPTPVVPSIYQWQMSQ